jgi:hypothetical protein
MAVRGTMSTLYKSDATNSEDELAKMRGKTLPRVAEPSSQPANRGGGNLNLEGRAEALKARWDHTF